MPDEANPPAFTLFHTPVGTCALVWRARGIVGVFLPEASAVATRARVQRRFAAAQEAAPPPALQAAVARIVALLNGEADALRDITLDMEAIPPFNQRVYAIARDIPPGSTLTYGEVAQRLGEPPHAARAVGQALGANPFPIIVPCHRVMAAHGQSGGFSAPGGTRTKLRLLEIERTPLGGTPGLFD